MVYATHPDLTPFAARVGRMVLFHGVADSALSIAQTTAWLNQVDAVGTERTRPLCAYPAVATYDGSGGAERAASFHCKEP
jgi:feruloyl esterase